MIENLSVTSLKKSGTDKTFLQQYEGAPQKLQNIYGTIKDYILSLGDDVTENQLKLYVAFKKIKNFICVEIYQSKILLHLRLNPDEIKLEDGFTRDMTGIGHFGTGDLQILIKTEVDFEKAKTIIDKAYNDN
ncbi:DUF5655 domain-containing protein [Eubacteriaceae bacterium ES2]|nr:DUF5655 domain-containing protein [Eubacteriaceae bacterium ES2]